MTRSQTDELIRHTAKRLFAAAGYDGVSMRILAQSSGVGLGSKDIILLSGRPIMPFPDIGSNV